MTTKKIIVTGGAGFIGSNITAELANNSGHDVTVIDNLSTGKIENLSGAIDRIKFVRGCITDQKMLRSCFEGADAVLHQAAIPSVQRSIDNPSATNEANVTGMINVLIAARDCGVKKLVFASSSSVYGDTPTLPKREDMTPNPRSPYAVSKLTGEHYARVFSEIYGLSTASLRYFNVYGPRQDPTSEYSAVIPRFITRVLSGKPPIIYGDGGHTRDFTFVKDVVHANILAMSSSSAGVYNIAAGTRTSLNDLAGMISEIAGFDEPPVYEKPRPGDVRDSLADIGAARRRLGYEPRYDLKAGLAETVKWYRGMSR
jgi:UDP-glucose 4-epimerase